MTNTLRTIALSLVTFLFAITATTPALATERHTVTVTVDQSRLDRDLGRCEGGRAVAVTLGSYDTHTSPRGITMYTVEVPNRHIVGGAPVFSVNLFCGDSREVTPVGNGVDITIHGN